MIRHYGNPVHSSLFLNRDVAEDAEVGHAGRDRTLDLDDSDIGPQDLSSVYLTRLWLGNIEKDRIYSKGCL